MRLKAIIPAISIGNPPDSVSVNSKDFSNCGHAQNFLAVKAANIINLRLIQFTVSIFFPSLSTTQKRFAFKNPLVSRIPEVIERRSKPKVGRIYASAVVAAGTVVKHMKSVWNCTKVKYPTNPMHPDGLTAMSARHFAVTIGANVAIPEPATFSDSNFAEKPLRACNRKTLRADIFWGYVRLHNNKLRLLLCHVARLLQQRGRHNLVSNAL